ncbi:MAG: SEL1-like repeat protein, partial [Gammaproteobacteria bacterium]|nr:SEL1-like repeat protein [Gammaproteobacteria bacterium]
LAAEWFQKSANQGYERAQVLLGSLYHTGDGVEKNYEKAASWYRKAADKGNAAAQYNLGTLYRAGNGVEQDYNQAVRWFRLSADQGYAAAQNELASIERAVAGANRPAPTPAPEEETTPVQTEATLAEAVPAESVEESSESIPTLAKTEPSSAEPVAAAAEEKEETPTAEPVEETAITESVVEEKPKRGFFSKLFGKKDVANTESEQNGVVFETPEEVADAETGNVPVAKTEIETAEEVVNPEPESSLPEVAVMEEAAEPETIDSSAPDVEEDVTAVEEPKRSFFSKLFGKKDDSLKQHEEDMEVPEVTEQPLDESSKVITYAADSAPEGQQLEQSPESKITEDSQQESITTEIEPPENISLDDLSLNELALEEATLAEPDLTDENAAETTIEEISEEDAPKKGFFSNLFSKNETEENTVSAEVADIDASEEPVIIAKLEEPDQD